MITCKLIKGIYLEREFIEDLNTYIFILGFPSTFSRDIMKNLIEKEKSILSNNIIKTNINPINTYRKKCWPTYRLTINDKSEILFWNIDLQNKFRRADLVLANPKLNCEASIYFIATELYKIISNKIKYANIIFHEKVEYLSSKGYSYEIQHKVFKR